MSNTAQAGSSVCSLPAGTELNTVVPGDTGAPDCNTVSSNYVALTELSL